MYVTDLRSESRNNVIIIIITRETSFLFQRLSMLIQRFNSALITDSFCFADEDPDL